MITNILKRLPWNQRRIAEVTEAIMPAPFPQLSQKSLEEILIIIHEFRDKRGARLQVRPSLILRDEVLDQIPSTLR